MINPNLIPEMFINDINFFNTIPCFARCPGKLISILVDISAMAKKEQQEFIRSRIDFWTKKIKSSNRFNIEMPVNYYLDYLILYSYLNNIIS